MRVRGENQDTVLLKHLHNNIVGSMSAACVVLKFIISEFVWDDEKLVYQPFSITSHFCIIIIIEYNILQLNSQFKQHQPLATLTGLNLTG